MFYFYFQNYSLFKFMETMKKQELCYLRDKAQRQQVWALVKPLWIGQFGFSKRSGKEQLMLRYFKGQYNILKLFRSSFWPA